MKKTKQVQETNLKTITDDIICNKCGNSLKRHHFGNPIFPGLISLSISGYFGSDWPNDLETIKFDLCSSCVKELIESFKIPAEKLNYFPG